MAVIQTDYSKLFSGFVSAMVSYNVVAPPERLKILKMTNAPKYAATESSFNILMDVYKTDGFTAFYKGNTANIVRIVPQTAMGFFLFDFCK